MNFLDAKEWALFGFTILSAVFTAGVLWTKLNSRIDQNAEAIKLKADNSDINGLRNSLEPRIKELEEDCSNRDGKLDTLAKQMTEYRSDMRMVAEGIGTINKGITDIREDVQETTTAITMLERIVESKDKATSNRLVRVETLTRIEQKIGPIPET